MQVEQRVTIEADILSTIDKHLYRFFVIENHLRFARVLFALGVGCVRQWYRPLSATLGPRRIKVG